MGMRRPSELLPPLVGSSHSAPKSEVRILYLWMLGPILGPSTDQRCWRLGTSLYLWDQTYTVFKVSRISVPLSVNGEQDGQDGEIPHPYSISYYRQVKCFRRGMSSCNLGCVTVGR